MTKKQLQTLGEEQTIPSPESIKREKYATMKSRAKELEEILSETQENLKDLHARREADISSSWELDEYVDEAIQHINDSTVELEDIQNDPWYKEMQAQEAEDQEKEQEKEQDRLLDAQREAREKLAESRRPMLEKRKAANESRARAVEMVQEIDTILAELTKPLKDWERGANLLQKTEEKQKADKESLEIARKEGEAIMLPLLSALPEKQRSLIDATVIAEGQDAQKNQITPSILPFLDRPLRALITAWEGPQIQKYRQWRDSFALQNSEKEEKIALMDKARKRILKSIVAPGSKILSLPLKEITPVGDEEVRTALVAKASILNETLQQLRNMTEKDLGNSDDDATERHHAVVIIDEQIRSLAEATQKAESGAGELDPRIVTDEMKIILGQWFEKVQDRINKIEQKNLEHRERNEDLEYGVDDIRGLANDIESMRQHLYGKNEIALVEIFTEARTRLSTIYRKLIEARVLDKEKIPEIQKEIGQSIIDLKQKLNIE